MQLFAGLYTWIFVQTSSHLSNVNYLKLSKTERGRGMEMRWDGYSLYVWFCTRNKSTTHSNKCYTKYNLVIKIKLYGSLVFFLSDMLILLTFSLSLNSNIDQFGLRVLTPFSDIVCSVRQSFRMRSTRFFRALHIHYTTDVSKQWRSNLNSKQIKGWINFVKGTFCQSLWFFLLSMNLLIRWKDEKLLCRVRRTAEQKQGQIAWMVVASALSSWMQIQIQIFK